MTSQNKTILSILVVIVFVAGVIFLSGRNPKLEPTNPLVSVHATGGMCVYGACDSEWRVLNDGSYSYTMGGKEYGGNYTQADMAELRELIRVTNFREVKSKPFTGTCPIAYDGQKLTYNFYTEKETIDSCEVAIDPRSPLFLHIEKLLNQVYQQLIGQ